MRTDWRRRQCHKSTWGLLEGENKSPGSFFLLSFEVSELVGWCMNPEWVTFDGSPGDLQRIRGCQGPQGMCLIVAAQPFPTFCSQPSFPYNRENPRWHEYLLIRKTSSHFSKGALGREYFLVSGSQSIVIT